MCIITRWFSRLTRAKHSPLPTNPLDELQVHGLDLPEPSVPTTSTLIQIIYQLALDIPALEEEFRKIQVSPFLQDVLMADIPILLLLDNVLNDGKWCPKDYHEMVSTFRSSLQRIYETGKNLQTNCSLTLDQGYLAKIEIEKNLVTMNKALQAFLLQKSPQDKLVLLMDLYKQRLQRIRVDPLRDNISTQGSSRSTSSTASVTPDISSCTSDQNSQPATPVSPSSNTSYFNGTNGAIFRGNQTFSAVNGSPVTLNATNSYIYFMQK